MVTLIMSVFMSIPRCFYYYNCVVQFEIEDDDTPSSPFIIQDWFGYLVCFLFLYEANNCVFDLCKDCVGILIGNTLNL